MRKFLCLLLLPAALAIADLPKFEDAGLINAGGSPISILLSSPCVYDWDGDGNKDLLLGQFTSGKVNLFLNTGANNSPAFTSSSFLQAGGSDISVSSG